jgi:hypothetical protein
MSACAQNQNFIWSLVQISAKNQINKQKLSVDVTIMIEIYSMTRLRTSSHIDSKFKLVDTPYQKQLYMTDFVRIVLIIYIYFWAVLNWMTLGEILLLVVYKNISRTNDISSEFIWLLSNEDNDVCRKIARCIN